MITRTIASTSILEDMLKLDLLRVETLGEPTQPVTDRVHLYQRLLDSLLDEIKLAGLHVSMDGGDEISSDNAFVEDRDDWAEETDGDSVDTEPATYLGWNG
jgi:hypothetical protein